MTGCIKKRFALSGYLVAIMVALSVQTAWAQTPLDCPPEPPSLVETVEKTMALPGKDRGYLWRITKDGRVSFLYGTMHIGRPEWIGLGPQLKKALKASDVVALELDPLDTAFAQSVAEHMVAVPVNLTPLVSARLVQAMKAVCTPVNALGLPENLREFSFLPVRQAQRHGLFSTFSSEIKLSLTARALSRTVVPLETVESQAAMLFESINVEDVSAQVESALDAFESGQSLRVLLRIADAWDRSNLEEVEDFEQWCECIRSESQRKQMRVLIDDRNPSLASSIDRMHSSGQRVFAGVGAAHMVGPKGLLALLQAMGFVVERVH